MQVLCFRGERLESEHDISAAVVDADGQLFAYANEPERWTYWRSAAKPLQALPFVESGAMDAFSFGTEVLALACASHSSEAKHMEIAEQVLSGCGASPADLACGAHPPILGDGVSPQVIASHVWAPISSNCSGKHAAMIALAKHLGAPTSGYEKLAHPVQQAILAAIARTTGMSRDEIGIAGDGCRAPTFFLPLLAMARAWAQLGNSTAPSFCRLREAMWLHPELVAGTGRSCTQLMTWGKNSLLAKIGAEGVYCAALAGPGLGIALKVHSGDMRIAPVALAAILAQLDTRLGRDSNLSWLHEGDENQRALTHPITRNTRSEPVGTWQVNGSLDWN